MGGNISGRRGEGNILTDGYLTEPDRKKLREWAYAWRSHLADLAVSPFSDIRKWYDGMVEEIECLSQKTL